MQSFEFLTITDVEKVHEATIAILENIGISTQSDRFKMLLIEHGCLEKGSRIFMPEKVVEDHLKMAPAEFYIYRRDHGPPLKLGQRKAYCQMGSGTPYILDPGSGKRRNYLLKDLESMTRLGNELSGIDIISCGIPTDVNEAIYTITEIATMLKNSFKPAHLPVESLQELPAIIELIALVAGGIDNFKKNPFSFLRSRRSAHLILA